MICMGDSSSTEGDDWEGDGVDSEHSTCFPTTTRQKSLWNISRISHRHSPNGNDWIVVVPQQAISRRFSSVLHNEGFVNSPINLPDFSTISTHSKYFGQSVMAQTTLTQSINFSDKNSNCYNTIRSYNTYNSDEDPQNMR